MAGDDEKPDWDKGLPLDVLAHIARGSDLAKAMRGTSKSWQAGFEASVSSIRVGFEGLSLPPSEALLQRFQQLTMVDIGSCNSDHAAFGALEGLPRIAQLVVGLRGHRTGFPAPLREGDPPEPPHGTLALRLNNLGSVPLIGPGLTHVDLSGCAALQDLALASIRGVQLTSLVLGPSNRVTSKGLAHALEGMPLTSLYLERCSRLKGGCLAALLPQFSALESLTLKGCVGVSTDVISSIGASHAPLRHLVRRLSLLVLSWGPSIKPPKGTKMFCAQYLLFIICRD